MIESFGFNASESQCALEAKPPVQWNKGKCMRKYIWLRHNSTHQIFAQVEHLFTSWELHSVSIGRKELKLSTLVTTPLTKTLCWYVFRWKILKSHAWSNCWEMSSRFLLHCRLWKVWPLHSVSHLRTLSKHRPNIVCHPLIPYWQCWNGLNGISCDASHAPIPLPIAQKRRTASQCKCHSISFRPHYSRHPQIIPAAVQTRTLFKDGERK